MINDCNINDPEPALCCLDCEDRDICPDRCPKSETVFCIGVIETNDEQRVADEI